MNASAAAQQLTVGATATKSAIESLPPSADFALDPRLSAEPVPSGRGWRFHVGNAILKLWGWTPEGNPPPDKKYVFIAAPHTSAWDFPFMMAFAWFWGVDIRWLGKHVLFEGPFGWFFRWMGGIAVERHKSHNMIQSFAHAFTERDELVLVIPAEGTRKYRDYWKSGFYWAARTAGVPICLGYMDFERKVGGFGPMLWPSDDLSRDMDFIRGFYAGMKGKHPKKLSRIRLRQEDEGVEAPEVKNGPRLLERAGTSEA